MCIFCDMETDSNDHLFEICDFILSLWYSVFRWLSWETKMPFKYCFTSREFFVCVQY